jgi:hypothetical protein
MTEVTARLALHAAREAARAGDLDEAARLLADLDSVAELGPQGREPAVGVDSVDVLDRKARSDLADPSRRLAGADGYWVDALDLKARVHAQRGEFAEADRCWARVQEFDADNAEAAAGRRTVGKILAGRRLARPLITAGRVTVVTSTVVCVLLAGGAAWLVVHAPAPAVAQQRDSRADELQRRLDAADAARTAAADRRLKDLNAIAAAMTMPGVTAQRRADDVQVVFDAGLFPSEVEISPSGAALLAEVGRRLAGLDVQTTVVGHSVAVPGGPANGGSAIALERAEVATQHLAGGAGLPLTAFLLSTADQTQQPFPDDARNRTVTLVISPKGE